MRILWEGMERIVLWNDGDVGSCGDGVKMA